MLLPHFGLAYLSKKHKKITHQSSIDMSKHEVKMVGYWPRSCVFMDRD